MRHFEKVSPLVGKIENCKLKITHVLIFIFACLVISSPHQVLADITTNNNWSIEIKDLNITSKTPIKNPSPQPKNDPPVPLEDETPLSFNISNNIIDYGPLSPTNQIYRTSNLSINTTYKNRFIVLAYEDHPLTTGLNSFIPDSTCDNGSCSEVTSSIWSNTLTYGFGYRCDNVKTKECPIDFNQTDYYRQFTDTSKNETSQMIMSSNPTVSNHEIQITYKVNISKTQGKGSYSNTITYIAVPDY